MAKDLRIFRGAVSACSGGRLVPESHKLVHIKSLSTSNLKLSNIQHVPNRNRDSDGKYTSACYVVQYSDAGRRRKSLCSIEMGSKQAHEAFSQ